MRLYKTSEKITAGIFFILAAVAVNICTAQSTVHGKVYNSKKEPAANASVLLLHAKDSSLIKGMVCDNSGMYRFNNIKNGSYLITTDILGYKHAYSSIFIIDGEQDDITVENLMLTEEFKQLNGVTVAMKKPLLEPMIDRLVINVASSITAAGNTALEVLERSPGIVVDRQNNTIAMNGKDGVVVMINGKKNYMPITALVQMLNGISANEIEKIELITTPPASFDAEGNAGYINIVMKQNNNFGTNGTASATLGYGKGWISEATMNINHRKGKINIYGDLSYSRIKQPFKVRSWSEISNKDVLTETDFETNRTDTTINWNGRLGLDWQAGKKTIAGILLTGFQRLYTQSEHNISKLSTNRLLDTTIHHDNNELNNMYNYGINLNLQHNFSATNTLLLNADYIYYYQNQPVNYKSSYYTEQDEFIYDRIFKSGKKTPMYFKVFAADYSGKMMKKVTIEAGAKQTFSAFDNDVSFENFIQNNWTKNDSLSARYKLNEDYTAVYASFNVPVNATTEIKAGLRYEHTNSNLGTESKMNIVDRHYGNLFPSFFITHKLSEKSTVDLSYSRRITRPTFNDLAPFTYYANANTLLTGNPALKASLSNNFKADYTFKQNLISLAYSREKNAITAFQPHTDSVNNKLILSAENLINQKTFSVIIAVPLTITNWWNIQVSTTGLWQQTNALYEGQRVSIEQTNVSVNANLHFTLPKNFFAEITGQYTSAGLYGLYRVKPAGSVDVGIKKKLPKKLGSLNLNGTNIFNTNVIRLSTNLPEQNLVSNLELHFFVPSVRLTYSLNFGNHELKQKRERLTGDEDERGRVRNN